jgi:hypothetical protein
MKNVLPILFLLLFASISFSQEKIENEFKPSGKVWGHVFGDYFYKAGGDTVAIGKGLYSNYPKDFNAFEFRRIRIGYDYKISRNFETRVSLEYGGLEFTSNSKRTVYIKTAKLIWKNVFTNSDLAVGLIKTPSWSFISEKYWGYRSIEKSFLDFNRISDSRDLGISLRGFFDDKKDYGYNITIGNGTGAKLENNKYKKIYGHLYSYLFNKKVVFVAYSDHEKVSTERSKTTVKSFLGFKSDEVTAGVEAFQQLQNNFIGDTADAKPLGISVFVRGNIVKDRLNYFGRFDYYDSDSEISNAGFKQIFITLGLDIIPHKNVHIMPNVWINTYSDKSPSNIDFAADIVPRITFYYLYK